MCLGLFSSLQINSQDKSEPVKKKSFLRKEILERQMIFSTQSCPRETSAMT